MNDCYIGNRFDVYWTPLSSHSWAQPEQTERANLFLERYGLIVDRAWRDSLSDLTSGLDKRRTVFSASYACVMPNNPNVTNSAYLALALLLEVQVCWRGEIEVSWYMLVSMCSPEPVNLGFQCCRQGKSANKIFKLHILKKFYDKVVRTKLLKVFKLRADFNNWWLQCMCLKLSPRGEQCEKLTAI